MSYGDARHDFQGGSMGSKRRPFACILVPPGDEPGCCRCIYRAELLKQFSVALQPSMRFIGAKVCGIEAIGLEPFEQCRKGGTCRGRRCILRHMSNQQVGNGGRLLWSRTLKGNPTMLAGGRSQECHNPEGLSKAHDRSGLGRIHASRISRPRASRPRAAKAASESATTTTVMARTAR